jgi:ribose 5-phosphate isomerase B
MGSDHAGYDLKEYLKTIVGGENHEIVDVGAHNTDPADYPDFAEAVASKIVDGSADRGILVCGSGVGASIAASKVPGVRAAVCHDCYSARQGVEHDDLNVLTLGSRIVGVELAVALVKEFLNANFSHDERHERRLNKVKQIEQRYSR